MEGDFRDSNILIAGLGLIGGSVAKALKKFGCDNIYAFDTNVQTLETAKDDGVVKMGYASFCSDVPAFDLVLCCLSPCYVVPLYEDVKPYLKDGGVFAEVGGIKTTMIHQLVDAMKKQHQLLSLHPMAGNEKSGYAYSESQMFTDSLLILTPTQKTAEKALLWAQVLKQAMGCERICELSASRHDEIIAHVSHIPHVAALAIQAMDKDRQMDCFAGGSYRAITRVADINSALWAGLMTDNRELLLKSIALFKQSLGTIEKAIEKGDVAALKQLLDDISNK